MNNFSEAAVYAFVGWVASIVSYVLFLMWAFLPETVLNSLGITYYPSKYYAVVLPAYVLVCYILSGMVYIGINLLNTPSPEELCTVYDSHSLASSSTATRDGIPEISDLEPMLVSHRLVRQQLSSGR